MQLDTQYQVIVMPTDTFRDNLMKKAIRLYVRSPSSSQRDFKL